MSASYQPISWNRQKRIYDSIILGLALLYVLVFTTVNLIFFPEITGETLIIRTSGTLAIFVLHLILLIGPLTRINKAFLPFLYNRRHLGVFMFCISLVHGIFSIIQFHGLGNMHPILSVFLSNLHYESLTRFPFQTLGFAALIIIFLMAISSHDFWLNNLGPRFWKTMHMMVYFAYALIILHVLLGIIQFETSPVFVVILGLGLMLIIGVHLISSRIEYRLDHIPVQIQNNFVRVCRVDEILENRAKVVNIGVERIAIFKYDGKISAVSNVCKHQNGPLGEGRIIDGCITCPWHGYQYLPQNGCSPPPFKEKIETYDVSIIDNDVWVNPTPYPEGTERKPAPIC